MVDMGITKFWIWGRKSRSVNIFSQRSDFGWLAGSLAGWLASQPAACHLEFQGIRWTRVPGLTIYIYIYNLCLIVYIYNRVCVGQTQLAGPAEMDPMSWTNC